MTGSSYHADGHKLSLLLSAVGAVEIKCPGVGHCEGIKDWGPEPTCIVQYNAGEDSDFLSCQKRKQGDEGTTVDLPVEIEWREWGTEGYSTPNGEIEPEYEFWWRPV